MKAKLSYEKFHNVKFNLSIIKKIINLCDKYLPEKKFPDKAFDIIDEAGAKTKINNSNIKEPLKVELNTVYIIFAQKLNTTVDNVKNDTNISVGNQIGFM